VAVAFIGYAGLILTLIRTLDRLPNDSSKLPDSAVDLFNYFFHKASRLSRFFAGESSRFKLLGNVMIAGQYAVGAALASSIVKNTRQKGEHGAIRTRVATAIMDNPSPMKRASADLL
jgi:hypothetical protein